MSKLEQRVEHIEKDVGEIKNTVKHLSAAIEKLSVTVERIETKFDEREKVSKTRFQDHEKRIDRLGIRFWAFIIVIIGGLFSLLYKAFLQKHSILPSTFYLSGPNVSVGENFKRLPT